MTRRMVIGQGNDEIGFWLTVAGKDALAANLRDEDFLIRGDSQNISLLMNGSALVPANKSVNVFFPEDIGERPVVAHMPSINGVSWVPAFINYRYGSIGPEYTDFVFRSYRLGNRYNIQSRSDRIVVTNRTPVNFNVRYLVFMNGLQ